MYQYRDVFIYMTILVACYTLVGAWLGEVSWEHKLFPWGSPRDVDTQPHWVDSFFAAAPFFVVGFFMASFEWIIS